MMASPSVSIPLQPEPEEYGFWASILLDDMALGNRIGLYKPETDTMEFVLLASGPLATILRSRNADEQQEWVDEHLRLVVHLLPTFDPTIVSVVSAKPEIWGEPLVDKRHYREKDAVVVTIVEKDGVP